MACIFKLLGVIKFELYYNQFITAIGGYDVIVFGVLALVGITFFYQIYYYISRSIAIVSKTKRSRNRIRPIEAVSVLVVIRDNLDWIERVLPTILVQKHNDFEVIVIDTGESIQVAELLAPLAQLYPHLIVTRFPHNPKFPISNKMAYNVGIKAASNNNILITTAKSRPLSEFWVSEFADSLSKSDIVLGYAGVERDSNNYITNSMRLTRIYSAMRQLSAAARRKPYKAFINNFGFRKELYFEAHGFNFLSLNIGEDDLFLQKIATKDNTSVILSENSAVVESVYGSLSSHKASRRYLLHSYKYYSRSLKYSIILERLVRVLFFASAITALVISPMELKAAVAGVILLRLLVVLISIKAVTRKFGEAGVISSLLLHDLISPIENFLMHIHRLIKPMKTIWR